MTPHSDTNPASAGNDALRPLALLASGMTGADVERLIRELRAKCRRQRRPLTWSVLENALRCDKSMPSLDVLPQIAALKSATHLPMNCSAWGTSNSSDLDRR